MLVSAILASSMGFIDSSVIAIAVPAIRAELGATLGDAQWVANAYLLMLASLMLVGGAAGDRFGVRNVFGGGIALFVVASMACMLAPDPAALILARVAQGLGAAFMVPASLAIIAKAFPKAERGRAIGIWAAASALATMFGPVLGGALLTWLGDWSWRLVFAINLPLGAAALTLLLMRVPADRTEGRRRLDIAGGVLASAALALLALGLTGEDGPPNLSQVVLYCGAGLVLLGGFLIWEARARAPMLPLGLFANPGFSGAQAVTFFLYFALAAVLFYLPMVVIAGWGSSPIAVSIALLPFGVALSVLSPITGALTDRVGPGPVIAVGALLVALAFLLLALLAPLQDVWRVVLPLMALFGIGMGLVISPLSTAVMTSVEDRDTGIASGVNNAVSRVSGLFAIAAMGGLGAMVFERALGRAAELPLYFGLVPEIELPAELETVRLAATNAAFASICYFTAGLALLSALIAWFALERRLPGRSSVT